MNFSVTKDGLPLDPSLYSWNSKNYIFSTSQDGLILDFSGINYCTFITPRSCTFKTGKHCNFITGWDCIFETEGMCTFTTGANCNFKTGWNCTFESGNYCTFETGTKSVVINGQLFWVIDISDYKKVKFLYDKTIDFDGEIMTYAEYKYLELVKII
jgi:hypothetical protein